MCCKKKKASNGFDRLSELKIMELINKKEQQKKAARAAMIRKICFAVTGLALIAAIAYAVYRYLNPDNLDEFDDEFEEMDFDDADVAVEITIDDIVEE